MRLRIPPQLHVNKKTTAFFSFFFIKLISWTLLKTHKWLLQAWFLARETSPFFFSSFAHTLFTCALIYATSFVTSNPIGDFSSNITSSSTIFFFPRLDIISKVKTFIISIIGQSNFSASYYSFLMDTSRELLRLLTNGKQFIFPPFMRYHGLGLSSLAFSLGFKGYPIFPVFMLDWALVMLFGVALRRHTFIQHIYLAVKKKKKKKYCLICFRKICIQVIQIIV